MLGTSVGNYQVTSQLGLGGMGVVYLAMHTMLGRPAAVKVLLPELSQNREMVNRFFNEARAATAIRHPGIVEVYDFGYLADGRAYIIMEYLEGESLSGRIAQVGRLSVAHTLALVRQIAGALQAAHQQKIVHRDLKPDNIFLVRDPDIVGGERIKLLDFGIAKLTSVADAVGGSSHTVTGTVMGTPTYMSPEQCRGSGAVDSRADLYALGCILYELLCGRPPYVAEGAGDVIAHHLYFPADPPSLHEPSLPDAVERLVMWLLQKDPSGRPAHAAAVLAAIDRILPGLPRASASTSTVPSASLAVPMRTTLTRAALQVGSFADAPQTVARPPLRWIVPARVVGVVVVVGVVALWLSRDRGSASSDLRSSSRASVLHDANVATALAVPAPLPPRPPLPTPVVIEDAQVIPAPVPASEITLAIVSEPAGAEVRFAGRRLGVTPFSQAVPRNGGARTYTVHKHGFIDADVKLDGDVERTEHVTLRKRARSREPDAVNHDDRSVNPFD
jgi:eukaryotic-like serine/threonine-protein kinase